MDLSEVLDTQITPEMSSIQDVNPLLASLSITFLLFVFFFGVIFYCVSAFFMMRLFRKANVEAWKAWVPVVNVWTFLKLGGYPGWIALLAFANIIPFIGWLGVIVVLVFECLAAYQIGAKLRKDGVWVILYIIFSIVWLGICGLDRSVWNDSLGKPSLVPGTPTSGGYGGGGYGGNYGGGGGYGGGGPVVPPQ
jgi:uncharacterized membrane protein YgcG